MRLEEPGYEARERLGMRLEEPGNEARESLGMRLSVGHSLDIVNISVVV